MRGNSEDHRRLLFFLAIVTLAACAPLERTETRTPLAVHSTATTVCHEIPRLDAKQDAAGLRLHFEEERACSERFIDVRRVRVVTKERPNGLMFSIEITIAGAGSASTQSRTVGGTVVGGLVAIPATIAVIVDASKYDKHTRYDREVSPRTGRTTRGSLLIPHAS